MENKQVIVQNGEYQCDIDITVEEWKEILQDQGFEKYIDSLIKFYSEPHHKSTCKALGEKYNISPQSFNGTITNFAKAVQKKLNRFEITGVDGKPTYWIIPMKGKDIAGGLFEWEIREELVKAISELKMGDELRNVEYLKFKKLLEYFVAHLEWVVNENTDNRGYEMYIEPLLANNNFKSTGQGYSGGNIQNQITDWEQYQNGRICINIQPNFGNYKSSKSYLNWEGTGINVIAKWNKNEIASLSQEHYLHWLKKPRRENLGVDKGLNKLGLFDNSETVTEDLKIFYNSFNKQILNYNSQQDKNKQMQEIEPYVNLLENNHNLILTGAPGTGKTFLAKMIVNVMDAEKEFVQFHPSYDYTDFVEGLRPTPPDDDGNIGFERKDGTFKEFCKKALKANVSDEVDNFEEAWEGLLTMVRNNLANGNLTKIGSWDYGLSTKDSLKYSSVNTPSQYNFTITKQNVYDAYQNKQARPSGAFQKDMEDVVAFMKKNQNLKDYEEGTSSQENGYKKHVLIIDEINRGEISKIFGELFFSIDPDYRGENNKVKTQYSNLIETGDVFFDGFFIPENVYIIGTMNDIDRSVESFDFAMRRRFAWKEIKAPSSKNGNDVSMWNVEIEGWKMSEETKEESKKRIVALNDKIESIQGLGSAFHIGPAYFLKLRNCNEDFEQLWNNHLEGVLFEYLRGLPDSEKQLIELRNAFNITADTLENVESN